MKFIKIGFFVLLIALVGFFLWGQYFVYKQSYDLELLEITREGYRFKAERNDVGVWHVSAQNHEDLWFAMGFLQAWDREFQTELIRRFSTGRLGEWFGAAVEKADYQNRSMAIVAKQEWSQLKENDPVKIAAQSYVLGRKHFIEERSQKKAEPVEYRVFQVDRKKIDHWEPWEVLAITRQQTGQFSFDVDYELKIARVKDLFVKHGMAELWEQPKFNEGVYSKEEIKPFVQSRLAPRFDENSPDLQFSWKRGATTTSLRSLPQKLRGRLNLEGVLGTRAASNIWVTASKKARQDLAICNDTHLDFTWPSMLYPISYEVFESKKAKGFMMAGLPALVIGGIDDLEKGDKLRWGITIALYADSQDLVELTESEVNQSEKYSENFTFKDPLSGKVEEKVHDVLFSQYGPVANSFLPLDKNPIPVTVAYDWVAYRNFHSPIRFFLNRQLQLQNGIQEDLAQNFLFPSVNFTWISQGPDKKKQIGHIVTGTIFDRENREVKSYLNLQERAQRKLSFAGERPYFYNPDYAGEEFFFANGNDQVFDEKLSSRLAWRWHYSKRNEQIWREQKQNHQDASFSQTDYFDPIIDEFVRFSLKNTRPGELCAGTGLPQKKNTMTCEELFRKLNSWDGQMHSTSVTATFSALWFNKLKQLVWPEGALFDSEDNTDLFVWWARKDLSTRLVMRMMSDSVFSEKYFAKDGQKQAKNWKDLSKRAFEDAFTLWSQYSHRPETLIWGEKHKVQWQHPFSLLPKPLGTMLLDSMIKLDTKMAGHTDAPGTAGSKWDPRQSLNFPVVYAADLRICMNLESGEKAQFDWTSSTGVSENTFSPWSTKFAQDLYFKDKLYSENL